MIIEIINDFINKMNSSTSSNNKVDIMMHTEPVIRRLLYYTYNNFLQYGVSSKLLKKRKDLCNKYTKFSEEKDLFILLDSLNQKMITGHKAIEESNGFLLKNPKYENIFYLILDRNLKIRASRKLINKAIPGLIPEFNVALANTYNEKTKKKVDLEKDVWYVSRKLDGVRCLVVVDEKGKAKSFSRAGKQFHTLSLVEKEIENLGFKNIVFDGEMCILDKNENENFQSIMKEISRKDYTISNGKYQIFDLINIQEFELKKKSLNFTLRLNLLKNILNKHSRHDSSLKYVKMLSQKRIKDFVSLEEEIKNASDNGWEGLMLRKNDVYKGKRSNDILKVKTFHDDEYIVEELNFGPFRYVKEGKEIEEDMVTAVSINHKGNTVSVGSGFTIEQRKTFYKTPMSILGKTITVQYFEESQNQNGDYSLRFPVLKAIYEKKREV